SGPAAGPLGSTIRERSFLIASIGIRELTRLCCAYCPGRSPCGSSTDGGAGEETSIGSDSRRLRASDGSGRDRTCGGDMAGRDAGREIGRAGGSAAAWIGDGRSPVRRASGGGGGIDGLDVRNTGMPSLTGFTRPAAAGIGGTGRGGSGG